MQKIKAAILTFLCFYTSTILAEPEINDDAYAKAMSEYQKEKTQIVEYMQKKESGTFLEIGSDWGDGLVDIIGNLSPNKAMKLIVADSNVSNLQKIPKRYPMVKPYLNDQNPGLKVELQQMDATYMHAIPNETLDGINASTIVHEVYSYVPVKHGLDQFFLEAARVLKPNGILLYRDPALQERPNEINVLTINNKLAKYFLTLFLPKFVDQEYTTKNTWNSHKPIKEYLKNTLVFLHLKNDHGFQQYPIQKFLSMPSHLIDFDKPCSIQAPKKLLSEIQRHYTLFLRDVMPIGFVDNQNLTPEFSFNTHVHPFARDCVEEYFQKRGISKNKTLSLSNVKTLKQSKKDFAHFVENGLQLSFEDHEHLPDLIDYLQNTKTNIHLFKISRNTIWLDSKLAALLFRGKNLGILKYFPIKSEQVKNFPIKALDWLKREGEENYYYFDVDELLKYLLELSRYHFPTIGKAGYILCPSDENAMVTNARELFEHTLNRDMKQMDMYGNRQDFVTTKNIIHFRLMKIEEGLQILNKIALKNPKRFKELSKALKKEKMLKF